jgi:FkbM family methyltransferase
MDIATAWGLGRSLVVYHARPWKKRSLARFYGQFIGQDDLCFDIGAHVGNRSAAMLATGGRVVAFEPQPVFLSFLQRFMAGGRMTVVGKGVGAREGHLTLRISRRHPTVTTLSGKWIEQVGSTSGFDGVSWDREHEIEVTTLDALIVAHGLPRFCKIDVEGMEADILRGLSQPIETVAFEYLPAALEVAQDCIARLCELGPYAFNRVVGEQSRFAGEWLSGADMGRELRSLPSSARSGDIYARLRSAP